MKQLVYYQSLNAGGHQNGVAAILHRLFAYQARFRYYYSSIFTLVFAFLIVTIALSMLTPSARPGMTGLVVLADADPESTTDGYTTLAHVTLQIEGKYNEIGGENASIGNPISNITRTLDGRAYYQNYSNGAIFMVDDLEAHAVWGDFYKKWESMGLERSFLGYPVTDYRFTPNKDAAYFIFQRGAIYRTPIGAFLEIHGEIYKKWENMGLERSFLGYPVTDVLPIITKKGSFITYFEGGSIRWEKNNKTFLSHSKDFNEYLHQTPREKGGKELEGSGINNSLSNGKNGIKIETIFKGIQFPTSMAFLDSNDILVLEKNNGTVQRIKDGEKYPEPLIDVNVANSRERGMLGIAVHEGTGNMPTYVFLYFTESKNKDVDNIAEERLVQGNKLYRYELSENGTKLTNPKLLLSLPSESSAIHNGGKLVMGPDENLYLVVGDLGTRETWTQNSINGSIPDGTSVIFRLTKDGEAAPENPFSRMSSLSKYYAYGIRNSFGIDFDSVTGKLWDTENGEGNFDEINIVEPGFNSGWKELMGVAPSGINFSNLVEFGGNGKYSDPEFVWNISIGVTALKFFHSDKFGPKYKDGLFVGDFVNGNLYFFELNDTRTGLLLRGPLADKIADDPEELNDYIIASGLGGITDIQVDPDGYLYISAIKRYYPLIDTEGIIYRIIPGD